MSDENSETNEVTEFAKVGDVIECIVQNPYQLTFRVQVTTPGACAYGNRLIALGRWRKVDDNESV